MIGSFQRQQQRRRQQQQRRRQQQQSSSSSSRRRCTEAFWGEHRGFGALPVPAAGAGARDARSSSRGSSRNRGWGTISSSRAGCSKQQAGGGGCRGDEVMEAADAAEAQLSTQQQSQPLLCGPALQPLQAAHLVQRGCGLRKPLVRRRRCWRTGRCRLLRVRQPARCVQWGCGLPGPVQAIVHACQRQCLDVSLLHLPASNCERMWLRLLTVFAACLPTCLQESACLRCPSGCRRLCTSGSIIGC